MSGTAARSGASKRHAEAGVASIEFVLVFPVLLLLFFGLINISHYISTSMKLSQSAVLMGDLLTRGSSLRASDFTDSYIGVDMQMTPLPTTNLRIDVYDFYKSDSAIIRRWKRSSPRGRACTAPNTNTPPISSLLNDTTRDVVVVVICMPYVAPVANFPGLAQLFRNITITRSISLQPRNSAKIDCQLADCPG